MASLPTLSEGIALTHFIVAADVERAARFYSDVLGGEIVLAGEPTVVALANSWIIINVGGGPTDDKPSVTLEPPQRSRSRQQLPEHPRRRHPNHLPDVERARRPVPHTSNRPRAGNPLLPPRPGRPPDRSRADQSNRPVCGLIRLGRGGPGDPRVGASITGARERPRVQDLQDWPFPLAAASTAQP